MPKDSNTFDRRGTLKAMACAGTGVLCALCTGVSSALNVFGPAQAAGEQTARALPVAIGDTKLLFWRRVLAGANKAAQDSGVAIHELNVTAQSEVDASADILKQLLGLKPTAVVIAAPYFASLRKRIGDIATGHKFIAIDTLSDTNGLTSLVATDNIKIGTLAADILAERIQKTYADAEGDVAIISLGDPALDERAQGFKKQIKSKFGALDIVSHLGSDRGAAGGQELMTRLIEAHPELRGVFVSNAALASSAAQSLLSSKTNKTGDRINLVCSDFDDEVLRLLKEDTIAAVVVQDPFRMGYEGVRTALATSKGEAVPARIDTEAHVITRSNMDSAQAKELLGLQL
jgi:ribose transport system substrate-binding protein